jgi:ubiquinone/menaquinone biosynthesis C-methylase UbiE
MKLDFMTLSFVDLLSSENDLILDAGSGSGRTIIALSRVMKNSSIVALDRFDSDYIENGGRSLLERNIKIAGIADKVDIVPGDITELQFKENTFNAAISTYMMDHLGKYKLEGLKEIQRVLKPGAKFLLVVFVPNWTTFSIFNIFSFVLTSKKGWRDLFIKAGLTLTEEGAINGGAYFLVEK